VRSRWSAGANAPLGSNPATLYGNLIWPGLIDDAPTSILTFVGLLAASGRRRPVVMGLLAGTGFLTRATFLALPYRLWHSLSQVT
jgi:hypothetical protein